MRLNNLSDNLFLSAIISFLMVLPILPTYARDMIDMPSAKLRLLDKITAKTTTFDVDVGTTVSFGDLYVKAQACRESTPLEEPESASFLQIWQNDNNDQPEWVFSGWMFASSPGLSHMDHPVYDVWVLSCFGATSENVDQVETAKEDEENITEETDASIEADNSDELAPSQP